jgi:hypothetical protein
MKKFRVLWSNGQKSNKNIEISCNNNSNNQISIVERVGNEIVAAGKWELLGYLIA